MVDEWEPLNTPKKHSILEVLKASKFTSAIVISKVDMTLGSVSTSHWTILKLVSLNKKFHQESHLMIFIWNLTILDVIQTNIYFNKLKIIVLGLACVYHLMHEVTMKLPKVQILFVMTGLYFHDDISGFLW